MPDPNGCPECAKVILNGDIAGANATAAALHLEAICQTIERHVDAGHEFTNIKELVLAANAIEDMTDDLRKQIDKFRRMVLNGVGFKGPWPRSLQ